jgi:hypothetical protein
MSRAFYSGSRNEIRRFFKTFFVDIGNRQSRDFLMREANRQGATDPGSGAGQNRHTVI